MRAAGGRFDPRQRLSLGVLLRVFWGRVSVTWGLTFAETALFAFIPLMIGFSIDGLLADDFSAFRNLLIMLGALLVVAIGRRVYDTRAYGTMRVALGEALVARAAAQDVSTVNARLLMGRELVDFLETEAPVAMTALIQVIVSIVILISFDDVLALAAGIATVITLGLYALFARRFFRLNGDLNAQTEAQVNAIASRERPRIATHLLAIRRHEVRISDTESLVYGLIFSVLLGMLAFNLWYAAAEIGASPGAIFSIVSYSFEFMTAASTLPMALQSLTRLSEITARINAADVKAEPETTP